MPQDHSPERRSYGSAEAEPTAAQMFDPAAFARRLELARAQRVEAIARRTGAEASSAPTTPHQSGDRRDPPKSAAGADPSGPPARDKAARATASPPGSALFDAPTVLDPTLAPRRRHLDAAEPLVAPPRRPGPPRAAGPSRAQAVAAAILLLCAAVAAAPQLRERAVDLAAGLQPGARLAEPEPPASPPAQLALPRLAALSEPAPTVAAAAPAYLTGDLSGPSPEAAPLLPILGRPPAADAPAAPDLPGSAPPQALDLAARQGPNVLVRAPETPAPAPAAAPRPPRATDATNAAAPVASGPVAAEVAVADPGGPTRVPVAASAVGIPRPVAADVSRIPAPNQAVPSAAGLSIAVHAPPRISDAALAETIATLGTAGFGGAGGVRVGFPIERTHVRYYHAADAAEARSLAATLAPGAEARDFTHFSPPPALGRLEVWLSGAAAEHSVAAATRAPREVNGPTPARQPALAVAAPSPDNAPKLVIGRKSVIEQLRPSSPLLDRLYALPDVPAAAPVRPVAPISDALNLLGDGLY